MTSVSRETVETILRINGVPPVAPEDQVRAILLSARFTDEEVDAALLVLRENPVTKQTSVQNSHKVFRSDKPLTPNEITQLLGIDVSVDAVQQDRKRIRQLSHTQFILIILIALATALAALSFVMYIQKIGIFHPTVGKIVRN